MGSWNSTCTISNLPIYSGEEVRTIIIYEAPFNNRLGGNYCYPTDLRFIFSLPFQAEYNSYGSIENIKENWYTNILQKTIKDKILSNKIKIKVDKYEEIGDEPYLIENFCNLIERGQVSINVDDAKYLKMNFILIKEDIYKDAIAMVYKHFKDDRYSKFFLEKEDRIKKIFEKLLEQKLAYFVRREIINVNEITDFYELFRYGDDIYGEVNKQEILEFMLKQENAKEILDDCLEMQRLYEFMRLTRKGFIEQAGGGSQDQEEKLFINFYKSCIKVAEKQLKKFDEE